MKPLRGTALYCGIGNTIEQMKEHLKKAASVGINAVFSSLQLPEADKEAMLRDFPVMTELAHKFNMIVDADISERSAKLFGIDLHDFKKFKQMGVDYARIDGGYTDEEIVAASHNNEGVVIELNAVLATDEWLNKVIEMGINKEHLHFCHNYYPMRYTGLTVEEMKRMNGVIHRYGFKVGGFIASQTHHRIACGIGLPTLERHREMDTFTAVQEAFMFGLDDLFFGDDFADASELEVLTEADSEVVTIRFRPFIEGELIEWLNGRVMDQTQCGLEKILRSNFGTARFPGNADETLSCRRFRGDVTVCKSGLWRYGGEIELVRKDLPGDKDIGLIGRIIDEDLPLLDTLRERKNFRLVRDR